MKFSWMRWILILYIIISLPLAAAGVFYLLVNFLFSSSDGFEIVPQDCIGMSIHILGNVVDADNQPIPSAKIEISSRPFTENFDLELNTDSDGHFEAESNMFICDELLFDVSAEGYEKIALTYTPLENYTEVTLPSPPVPIRLKIVLLENL
jgi:hypothetical protein